MQSGRRTAVSSSPPSANELVALDAEGNVRWSLARRAPAPAAVGGHAHRHADRIPLRQRLARGRGRRHRRQAARPLCERGTACVGSRAGCTLSPISRATTLCCGRAIRVASTGARPFTCRRPTSNGRATGATSLCLADGIVVLDAAGHVHRTISMPGTEFLRAAFAARLAPPRRRHPAHVAQRGAGRRRRPARAREAPLRRAQAPSATSPGHPMRSGCSSPGRAPTSGSSCTATACTRSRTSRRSSRPPTAAARRLRLAGRWCCG